MLDGGGSERLTPLVKNETARSEMFFTKGKVDVLDGARTSLQTLHGDYSGARAGM